MPLVTPQYGPAFPYRVGMLLFDGVQNGQKIYSQPGGIGTPVVPLPPQMSPPQNWKNQGGIPTYPTTLMGLLSWGCGHWTNTAEAYFVGDPYSEEQAALICCPVCLYLGYIIEPAADWFQEFFSVYPTGISQKGGGLIPNET